MNQSTISQIRKVLLSLMIAVFAIPNVLAMESDSIRKNMADLDSLIHMVETNIFVMLSCLNTRQNLSLVRLAITRGLSECHRATVRILLTSGLKMQLNSICNLVVKT